MATTKKQFYRKPLPSSCIEFTSTEGKKIFKEALNEGTMDCFFSLAAQFRTQDEPAYCGLSTLVMVLNALSVDPGRVWKGPWRWYHESMLECCVPLDVVKKEGITLFNFSCLAMCNGLDVDLVRALETATITEFRDVVRRVTKTESQILVCSYSRAILSQTGDGHFSPIGGYHAGRDLVLIFDVARFKYPPHWVTVDLLWKAMKGFDKETGQPRGYMTLSRTVHTGNPTILFKVSNHFQLTLPSEMNPKISEIVLRWQTWLTTPCTDHAEKKEFLGILVSKFLSLWCAECFPGLEKVFTIKVDNNCCKDLSQDHRCAICDLILSLERLPLFQVINESLSSGEHTISECWDGLIDLKIVNQQLCCAAKKVCGGERFSGIKLDHFATMMLLAWPYPSKHSNNHNESHADFCVEYITQEMSGTPEVLGHEVKLLKAQLSTVFLYYESFNSPEVLLNKAERCKASECKKQ